MRRSIRAAALAALLLVAAGVVSSTLAACGGSPADDAQAQTRPSGTPQPGGPMGDPSTAVSSLLDTLVANDVISSSQADAAAAALGTAMEQLRPPSGAASPGAQPTPGVQPSPGARPPDPSALFSSALDALVKVGVITNDQKTAIVDALSAAMGGAPPGAPTGAGQSAGGSSF
jgi:hypothetical protein